MKEKLIAIYDLRVSNANYEFFMFLQFAEMHRVRYGFSHIDILIHPVDQHSDNSLYKGHVTQSYKDMMLRNVIMPAGHLLPSCRSIFWIDPEMDLSHLIEKKFNIFPRDYTFNNPVAETNEKASSAAFLRGERFQRLSAPDDYHQFVNHFIKKIAGNKKILTLTLRQTSHFASPGRSPNSKEWASFFSQLDSREFQPVIVSDTEHVFQELPELAIYPHAPSASMNILFRAALYQQSYANFFSANGPAALSKYCHANSLVFKIVDNSTFPSSEKNIKAAFGVEVGDQAPISPINFRWCWEDDSCENIIREFDTLRNTIEKQQSQKEIHGTNNLRIISWQCRNAILYTLNKFTRSIWKEDLDLLKSIEKIGQHLGGDSVKQLSTSNILRDHIPNLSPNFIEQLKKLDRQYGTELTFE